MSESIEPKQKRSYVGGRAGRVLAAASIGVSLLATGAMLERSYGPFSVRALAESDPMPISPVIGPVEAMDSTALLRQLDLQIARLRSALDLTSRSLKENQILLRMMDGGGATLTELELRRLKLRVEELVTKSAALQDKYDELVEVRSLLVAHLDISEIQEAGVELKIERPIHNLEELKARVLDALDLPPVRVRWDVGRERAVGPMQHSVPDNR